MRTLVLAFAAGSLAISGSNAAAQTAASATSPKDDLDCAMFLSAVLSVQESEISDADRSGIISGMTYFVGRYEAVRGDDADTAMVARYSEFRKGDFAIYQKVCTARMSEFGARLQTAGKAITAIEEAEDGEASKTGGAASNTVQAP